MPMLLILVVLLFAASADAQELIVAQTTPPSLAWGYAPPDPVCTATTPGVMVQRSATATGTFSTLATLPISATTYNLPTTADSRYYRVATACGQSNVVQYVASTPPPTDPTIDQRLTAVETKNAAQDLALSSLAGADTAMQTKNAQQDSTIGTIGSQLVTAEGRIASVESKNTAQDATLTNLTQRILLLENPPAPPAPTSNLKVMDLSADQVEIMGLNCASLKTTGTGTKRIVTCVH